MAATVASARSQGDTATWLADPADLTGATTVLTVQSSEPFVHLFLYPNGNFQITAIEQPACHVIVGPSGPGVGCETGSTGLFQVRFRTAAAIPAGTDAKLVLDNAGAPGARALTVTLKDCTAQARAHEDKKTRLRVAYENATASFERYKRTTDDLWGQFLRDAAVITRQVKKAAPDLSTSDIYPHAFVQATINVMRRVLAASEDALDELVAEPRPAEDDLDDHRVREQVAHHHAGECEDRRQGVPERVQRDDPPFRQALRSQRPHVVARELLEHRGADHAQVDRDRLGGEHDRRHDQELEPL
jgi:hypothetical protein